METSYNGWTASTKLSDLGGLTELKVGTETFPPGVRSGDVWTVLSYVATQLDARVEPVAYPGGHASDDWGYSYRPNKNNPRVLSCHASGTAFDYNATRHPNGKRGTFTPDQVKAIRTILAEVGGAVRWGGDFTGTPDEMHFEIVATPTRLAVVAAQLGRHMVPGASTPTVPEDWFDMATQADLEAAVLKVIRGEGVSGAGDAAKMLERGYKQANYDAVRDVLRSEGVSGAGDTGRLVAAILAAVPSGQGYISVETLETVVKTGLRDFYARASA